MSLRACRFLKRGDRGQPEDKQTLKRSKQYTQKKLNKELATRLGGDFEDLKGEKMTIENPGSLQIDLEIQLLVGPGKKAKKWWLGGRGRCRKTRTI